MSDKKNVSSGKDNKTPLWNRYTTAGVVSAGARSVSFTNSGLVDDATVMGVTLKQGEEVFFDAGGIDDVLRQIEYDPGTSELVIVEIR